MKLKSVVAASFAVLVLAGCGSQAAAPAPVVTVTKSVEAPAAPAAPAYGSIVFGSSMNGQDTSLP